MTTQEEAGSVVTEDKVDLETYLNQVFANGVLASVHISRMSWHQRLLPSDYGMEKFPTNFKAGHRVLLEGELVEKVSRMESQTRYWLEQASLKFPVELIRFVPKARLGELLSSFNERKKTYSDLVENLIASYEDLKQAAKDKYPDQWDRMVAAYPSPEKIRASHSMRLETFEYAFPRSFANADTSLDRLKADRDYVEQTQAMVRQQEEQTRRTMAEFLENTIRELRGRVVERFEEVITAARGGNPPTARTITSLRNLMTHVKSMDFIGDSGFQTQLRNVESQLETATTRTFQDSREAMSALDAAMSGVIAYGKDTTNSAVRSMTGSFLSGKRKLNI